MVFVIVTMDSVLETSVCETKTMVRKPEKIFLGPDKMVFIAKKVFSFARNTVARIRTIV